MPSIQRKITDDPILLRFLERAHGRSFAELKALPNVLTPPKKPAAEVVLFPAPKTRSINTAERPADLSTKGRKRKPVPAPVTFIPGTNRLALTDEERKERYRQSDRARHARDIARETPEQRHARREKQKISNAKFKHKKLMQRFIELQGGAVGAVIEKMREKYETAMVWAMTHPDPSMMYQLRRPYSPYFGTIPNLQDQLRSIGEKIWRLDVRIRYGWARPWNGFTPGYAVSVSGKPQNFAPGTTPPVSNYSGDVLKDWRF